MRLYSESFLPGNLLCLEGIVALKNKKNVSVHHEWAVKSFWDSCFKKLCYLL